MSDYKLTRDAAGKVTTQYRQILKNLEDDLVSDDKPPFYLVLQDVVDHEDGGATYSFDIGDDTRNSLAKIGLEFVLHCAATGTDIQDAYNMILYNTKAEEKFNAEDTSESCLE